MFKDNSMAESIRIEVAPTKKPQLSKKVFVAESEYDENGRSLQNNRFSDLEGGENKTFGKQNQMPKE